MIIILQWCGSSQTEKVRKKPKTNSKSELYFNASALSVYEQDRFPARPPTKGDRFQSAVTRAHTSSP